MDKFKVGDKVAITPEASRLMKLHCLPHEIPEHNHGTVKSVIDAHAPNHTYRFDPFLVNVDMITVDLESEILELPARDLMLLY